MVTTVCYVCRFISICVLCISGVPVSMVGFSLLGVDVLIGKLHLFFFVLFSVIPFVSLSFIIPYCNKVPCDPYHVVKCKLQNHSGK